MARQKKKNINNQKVWIKDQTVFHGITKVIIPIKNLVRTIMVKKNSEKLRCVTPAVLKGSTLKIQTVPH